MLFRSSQNIADLTLEKARSFAPQTKTSMQLDQALRQRWAPSLRYSTSLGWYWLAVIRTARDPDLLCCLVTSEGFGCHDI